MEHVKSHLGEFDSYQSRSLLVKRIVQVAVEKGDAAVDMAAHLLQELFFSRAITKTSVRRALDRVFLELDELLIDQPGATRLLTKLLTELCRRKVVPSKILCRLSDAHLNLFL